MKASLPWLTADEAANALFRAIGIKVRLDNVPDTVTEDERLILKLVQALSSEQSEVERLFLLLEQT